MVFVALNYLVFDFNNFAFLFFYMFYVGYIAGTVYLNTFFIIT